MNCSDNRINSDEDLQRFVADKVRIITKELGWAVQNLRQLYEAIRPADMRPMEDPNQLKLFNDGE